MKFAQNVMSLEQKKVLSQKHVLPAKVMVKSLPRKVSLVLDKHAQLVVATVK